MYATFAKPTHNHPNGLVKFSQNLFRFVKGEALCIPLRVVVGGDFEKISPITGFYVFCDSGYLFIKY